MNQQPQPKSIEELTARFKAQMSDTADREAEIVKSIGFVTKVEDGVAYTKELKLNRQPAMFIAFADKQFLHSQYLGECLTIAAGHAQHEGTVRLTYPLHVRINIGTGDVPELVPLANRVLKVSNEQIIDHITRMGCGLFPQEGMEVYLMQFGDARNNLPDHENYEDVGQLTPGIPKEQLGKLFTATKGPSKPGAPKLNNWLQGYKPAVPAELLQSKTDQPEPDTVETTTTLQDSEIQE